MDPCPRLSQASTSPGPGLACSESQAPPPCTLGRAPSLPLASVLGARLALLLDLQQQGALPQPSTPGSVAHFLETLTSPPNPEHLQPPAHVTILPLGSSAQVSLSRNSPN